MKSAVSALLRRFGYSIVRAPRGLVQNPRDQINLFGAILAHWIGRLQPLHFVQIGAYDGAANDFLARYIHRYDLHGVLVEPQADPFQRLSQLYDGHPHVTLRNVAVATTPGRRTLYTVTPSPELPDWVGQIASFDRDTVVKHEAWAPGLSARVRQQEVECLPLDDVIADAGLDRIDLFQIDTEGYDYEIIKMIDLERWRPKIIHYEHVHLSKVDDAECVAYLRDAGYRLAVEEMDTTAYLAG